MVKRFTLILVIALAGACSPAFQARQALQAAEEVFEQVEPLVPETREGEIATTSIEEALELGEVATDVWRRDGRRDDPPEGYAHWVDLAIQAFRALFNILEASGVEVPPGARLGLLGLDALL